MQVVEQMWELSIFQKITMYKIISVAILLLLSLLIQKTNGQNIDHKYADSLKRVASKTKADSNVVKAFLALQRYYFNKGLYDSALKFATLSVPLAEKAVDKKMIARIYYNNGLIYTNLTRYDSAFYYTDKASNIATQISDTALLINCFNSHALLCNYQSDFNSAISYLMQAANLIEKSSAQYKVYLPQVYGNIGHNLIAENQLQKGIAYEQKALLQKDYPDEDRYRVMLHLDITDAYLKSADFPAAKPHLDSAILLNKSLNNIQVTSLVANTEGAYYEAVEDLPRSLNAFMVAYELADNAKNEYLKAEAADNLAQIYFKLKKLEQASRFAIEANAISKKYQHLKVTANSYGTLKNVAVAQKNYAKALEFAELNKRYADSASNAETQKTTVYLESKYQNEKKEKEIAGLQVINTQRQLMVLSRNRFLIIGGIIAVAVMSLLSFKYRNSKQKQIIVEKEKEVQQQHIQFLEKQQQVVSMQSMVNGQETERTRIARDLHDGLGGLFSTIKMQLSTLKHEEKSLETNELFLKSYELVDNASVEVRRIAHNMMPEVLIKLGLVQATRELCNSINAGRLMSCSMQSYGMEQRLNASTEMMLFRIIQELLNNIIKHACATEAIIQFNRDGQRLSVTVEDNGRGFNLEENSRKKAGLESVKSRVSYLNGKLSIDSEKEVGTTVLMDFLINEQ